MAGERVQCIDGLRRGNLFARQSWQRDPWQPALDLLFTPVDGGRIVAGSWGWQRDRVQRDAGLRLYGGPAGAVLAQWPIRCIVVAAATWSFRAHALKI